MKYILSLIVALALFSNTGWSQNVTNKNPSSIIDALGIEPNQLLKKYINTYTFGELPNIKCKYYEKQTTQGRFGRYILMTESLVDDLPTSDIVGSLVVFRTRNKKEVEFIEFISNSIATEHIYNKGIQIGSSLELLTKVLGKPYRKIGNYYLYKDSQGVIAIFSLANNKITMFRVGKYSENTINNLDTNLTSLMNHYP